MHFQLVKGGTIVTMSLGLQSSLLVKDGTIIIIVFLHPHEWAFAGGSLIWVGGFLKFGRDLG
jgi:hypothetical protein